MFRHYQYIPYNTNLNRNDNIYEVINTGVGNYNSTMEVEFFKLYGYHYNEILDILWEKNFEIYEYDNKKNLYLVSAGSNPAKGDLIAISDQEDFLLRTGYKINN